MNDKTPGRDVLPLPYEELRTAVGSDRAALQRVEGLHQEMRSDAPDRGRIEEHVSGLRGIATIEATIANWWDSPDVQRFVNNLTNAGL